ncbi:MAG: Holliday junction branch migration protein RuvA [Clostridia bacterium]|nr:Holliday junction branch migration protein RuvA [Clostridia bacterium]
MYYYIKGKAAILEPNLAVIEAGGVGYAVNTSLNSVSAVKQGEEVLFYTYLYIAEGVMKIYGFKTQSELLCFKQLIGVSGVGPKAAISILSVVTPEKLASCIATADEAPICAASGVGKKLAQRILLDLKDKLDISVSDAGAAFVPADTDAAFSDAVAALIGLGYTRQQVLKALSGEKTQGLSSEELVRAALKKLMLQ